jgi:hypothetical protein
VQPTTTPEHLAIFKNNIDLALEEAQDALHQEADGINRWIDATLKLITNLDAARKCFASDQAFGKWLTDSDYSEERLSRHDRAALLNMALYPDITREVLGQTHRRSYQLIWRDEIQPRLPNARQPTEATADNAEKTAEGDSTTATSTNNPEQPTSPIPEQPADEHKTSTSDDHPKETQASKKKGPTRRQRTNGANKASNDPWAKDRKKVYEDGKSITHGAKELKNKLLQCNAEQKQDIRDHADQVWLKGIKEASEDLACVYNECSGKAESAEAEADELTRRTERVRKTPAQASTTVPLA